MTTLYFTSCDSFTKPHLSITENTPYILTISDFDWSYGLVRINEFSGDFETLDRKVFNLLDNKQGSCSVVMSFAKTNKYGKGDTSTAIIGVISLSELNKYQSWEYWHKDGGIRRLLYQRMFPPQPMDTTRTPSNVPIDTVKRYADTSKTLVTNNLSDKTMDANHAEHTFSFSSDDLYDDYEDRSHIDSLRHIDSALYRVDGIISGVYPSRGTIMVHATRGVIPDYIIHVFPYRASIDVRGRLLLALRVGSEIHCVCAGYSGITQQLISADITFHVSR